MNKPILLVAVLATAASALLFQPQGLRPLVNPQQARKRAAAGGCEEFPAQRCFQPIEHLMNRHVGLRYSEVDTEEKLSEACRLLDEVNTCLQDALLECGSDPYLDPTIRSVEQTAGFICRSDNRQVILEQAPCWDNAELDPRLENCYSEPEEPGNFCSTITGVRRCLKRETMSVCDSAVAADFLDGVVYNYFEPYANDLMRCNLPQRLTRRRDVLPFLFR